MTWPPVLDHQKALRKVVGEIVLASKNEQSDDGLVNGGLRRSIVVASPGGKHSAERVRQMT